MPAVYFTRVEGLFSDDCFFERMMMSQVMCKRCRNEWVAIRPVETDVLECPKCGYIHSTYETGLFKV